MPTVIGFRFPWGRYHATSWETAANEGAPEWPPSPWRILRALFATHRWRVPDIDHGVVSRLLGALATAPEFHLPQPTAVAHTRHYLPGIAATTAKVFDPFVVLDREREVLVRWEVEVGSAERDALSLICEQLAYLGRAEAICSARLVGDGDPLPTDGWVAPGSSGRLDAPLRRVLAPTVPLDLAALALRTADVRRSRRLTPPGTRWLAYDVVADQAPASIHHRRHPPPAPAVEAVSLALGAAVQPSVRDTVWVAHVARAAAMSHLGDPSPILAGKDAGGTPLSGHGHAHYLPLDRDGDGLLDTLLVWAPSGLGPEEVGSLSSVPGLWNRVPGFRPLRVAMQGVASVLDLAPELVAPDGARTWESLTPFAPYRHQKREPDEVFYAAEVARELATRGLPPADVALVPGRSWLDWRRSRPNHRPELRATGLRLRFAEPVSGPLSLGALSHFGLGLFRPLSR